MLLKLIALATLLVGTLISGFAHTCAEPSANDKIRPCTPTAGQVITLPSPVHFTLNAGSKVARTEIWGNGQLLHVNTTTGALVHVDITVAAGSWQFTIYGKNRGGTITTTVIINCEVQPAPSLGAPSITTTTLPNGAVGTAYSQQLSATGGQTPYTWAVVTGALPAGLSLSSAGLLSGTPSAPAIANFTVRVTDAQSPAQTDTQDLTLTVTALDIYVSPTGSDANNGTQASPVRTISRADALSGAGTTVHVAAGSYTGPITTTKDGTSSGRIHFVSEPRGQALITFPLAVGGQIMWKSDGDYVDIEGFDLSNMGSATGGYVVQINGSNVRFYRSIVHDYGGNHGVADAGGFAQANIDYFENVIRNGGNASTHAALWHANSGGSIYNNLVYSNTGDGIRLSNNGGNTTIVNNTVFGNSRDGIRLEGSIPNTPVFNNISANHGTGSGFTVTGATQQATFSNNLGWLNSVDNTGVTQTNFVSADPKFTNWAVDFHLQNISPAIDAGRANLVSGTRTGAAPSADYDANVRPIGPSWDIGAYENLNPAGSGLHSYVATTGSDSSPGTQASPFRTIQFAMNVATPGTTVHVAPGTYNENNLIFTHSGSSTQRIRLLSDTKWGALIRSTSYRVVRFNAAWIDIIGFDVSGSTASVLGIDLGGISVSKHNRALGNKVHDIYADPVIAGSNGGAGILSGVQTTAYDRFDNDVIGNVIFNIGYVYYVNNARKLDARTHGIYPSNMGGLIQNNVIYNCAGFGIHMLHYASDHTIVNNLVDRCGYGGVYLGATEGTGVAYNNALVANNILINNANTGNYVDNSTVTTLGIIEAHVVGTNRVYKNNLVRGNGTNISLQSGATQSGNITTDSGQPTFVNYAGFDFHLVSTSQARNAGSNADSAGSTRDHDGGTRPLETTIDIGPFEFGSVAAAWPWY